MGIQIRKRGSKYYVEIYFRKSKGEKPIRKMYFAGYRKQDAEERGEKEMRLLRFGREQDQPPAVDQSSTVRPSEFPTMKNYWEFTFKDFMSFTRPNTAENCSVYLEKHVLPVFGTQRLNEITKVAVQRFIRKLKDDDRKAKDTIRLAVAYSRMLFNHAIENFKGKDLENPFSKMGDFYKNAPKRHLMITPFDMQEVPIFLRAAMEHSEEAYFFLLTALQTGVRISELLALEWSAINWKTRKLLINKGVDRLGRVFPPKNGKPRSVPISKILFERLSQLRKLRERQFPGNVPKRLFVDPDSGEPQLYHVARRKLFLPVMKKSGLESRRIHDLRHTFCSMLLSNGETIFNVSKWMGHSSIDLTYEVYSQQIDQSRKVLDTLPDMETPLKVVSR